MLNHHDLEDLTPTSKAYDTEREVKDNAQPGYYALLDVDCMKWFNYNQELGFQNDSR